MAETARMTQIDSRGQLVIPKEIRDVLKIDEKTRLVLFTVSGNGLFIKKSKNEKVSKRD